MTLKRRDQLIRLGIATRTKSKAAVTPPVAPRAPALPVTPETPQLPPSSEAATDDHAPNSRAA